MGTQRLLAACEHDAHSAYRPADRQCSTAASDVQRYLPLSALLPCSLSAHSSTQQVNPPLLCHCVTPTPETMPRACESERAA